MLKAIFTGIMMFASIAVFAHCQIPCGIFDDDLRITSIQEDISTIEKSINEIARLQLEKKVDFNQMVRWINNKETHAGKIQTVIAEYFLAQRVKPVADKSSPEYADYIKKLTALHEVILAAMKSKQSLDLENVKKLRTLAAEMDVLFGHKH